MIVFAAIPYGVVGALVSLAVMGSPFGFMAFLGIISLIGVIVSHVIALFDFIEEKHEEGEPLRDALIDAGVLRLRPVLITVGATVFALVPLTANGGPLWEPLCYTQIGGLTIATLITLLNVPVLYAIFVLDLKIVKWDRIDGHAGPAVAPALHHDTDAAASAGTVSEQRRRFGTSTPLARGDAQRSHLGPYQKREHFRAFTTTAQKSELSSRERFVSITASSTHLLLACSREHRYCPFHDEAFEPGENLRHRFFLRASLRMRRP